MQYPDIKHAARAVQHPLGGTWYMKGMALAYHPQYPIIQPIEPPDTDTGHLPSFNCLYAGYEVHDRTRIAAVDSCGDSRWAARAIAARGTHLADISARTKCMLLEAIDRQYEPRVVYERRYQPGCPLRHGQGDRAVKIKSADRLEGGEDIPR